MIPNPIRQEFQRSGRQADFQETLLNVEPQDGRVGTSTKDRLNVTELLCEGCGKPQEKDRKTVSEVDVDVEGRGT